MGAQVTFPKLFVSPTEAGDAGKGGGEIMELESMLHGHSGGSFMFLISLLTFSEFLCFSHLDGS